MKRKSRVITVERHKQIGRELFRIRLALLRLHGELNIHYRASAKPYKAVDRALRNVDSLRCVLDSELARTTEQAAWHAQNLGRTYYCGNSEQIEAELDARLPRSEVMTALYGLTKVDSSPA